METRLTRFLEEQGFDTQVQRAIFDGSSIEVPTLGIALKDVLAVVPPGKPGVAFPITHKGETVAFVSVPPRTN